MGPFMHEMSGGHWLAHGLMWVLLVTVLALAVFGVYSLFTSGTRERSTGAPTTLRDLAAQYAAGEISQQEYLSQQRKLLDDKGPGANGENKERAG